MSSKMAWILAGIFGIAVLCMIVAAVMFPSPTAPTSRTTAGGRMAVQKSEYPLTHVLPAEPDGAGDAGDDYHQAVAALKGNLDKVGEACRSRGALAPGDRKLLEEIHAHVAAGADKRKMTYAFRFTPQEFVVDYADTEAEDLQSLGQVLGRLFEHYVAAGKSGYGQAERVMFDLLVMGHHMVAERARLDSVVTGAELQREACSRLEALYGGRYLNQPAKADKAREYRHGLDGVVDIYALLRRDAIWNYRVDLVAGDVFNLVEHHGDRAVRVEATLALGTIRLRAGKRGDQRYVRKLIAKQLASSDPIERAAAQAANTLDRDGLNRLMNPTQ